jgi:GNAT superfamily N-acetyltransferase
MEIRRATADDAVAISDLIRSVAHHFTLDPRGRGAEAFLQTIEPEAIRSHITAANFSYFVASVERQMAGAVALRDHRHLYHLFVRREFQGRGLSRQLWQHVRELAVAAGNLQGFTVNSSVPAVPVYLRFGFEVAGPRVETKGIAFVPMNTPGVP